MTGWNLYQNTSQTTKTKFEIMNFCLLHQIMSWYDFFLFPAEDGSNSKILCDCYMHTAIHTSPFTNNQDSILYFIRKIKSNSQKLLALEGDLRTHKRGRGRVSSVSAFWHFCIKYFLTSKIRVFVFVKALPIVCSLQNTIQDTLLWKSFLLLHFYVFVKEIFI